MLAECSPGRAPSIFSAIAFSRQTIGGAGDGVFPRGNSGVMGRLRIDTTSRSIMFALLDGTSYDGRYAISEKPKTRFRLLRV